MKVCIVDKLETTLSNIEVESASITVTQLNKLAKTLLENNMPIFWIKGEVSGLKIYNHAYFDLKDEGSKISCIVFATTLSQQTFALENGQQIEVRGRVTIYPVNGSYQINIERIRSVGMGELWEAYQRLLNKLKLEGLFDIAHKKPLPVFPRSIGIITSKEGAVIRDVITTLKRRMPNIQIIIYNTLVQGTGAGMNITQAIRTANVRNETDVLIVCRGGGSMQDLWCFNEEIVAREVYASAIPIISAIGHETDTTIIDFVADVRAPTPTAAAEIVAKSRMEWLSMVDKLQSTLHDKMLILLNNKKQQLDLDYSKLKLLNPLNQLNIKLTLMQTLTLRLKNGIKQHIKDAEQHLSGLTRQLNLISPNNVLDRGYAIVRNSSGHVIFSRADVTAREHIEIVLKQDTIKAIVENNLTQRELI